MAKPMTEKMKEEFRQRKLNQEIYSRIHAKRRSKFSEPERNIIMLPEDYTGKDLKKVKKLIAKRMKEETKDLKKRLSEKKIAEINAIAKKLHFPLRGNKRERINALVAYFKVPGYWKTIING